MADISEKENNAQLEKFFGTKKFYMQLGLIALGVILVIWAFKKMKVEHAG